jgi:hypothetical protein
MNKSGIAPSVISHPKGGGAISGIGAKPGGTGPVRVDFNVPTQALAAASKPDWFQIFNEGRYVPIHDVTIVRP